MNEGVIASSRRYKPSARERRALFEQLDDATTIDLAPEASPDAMVEQLAHAVSAMADAPCVIHRPEPRETGWGLEFIGWAGLTSSLPQAFRDILMLEGVVLPYNPLRPATTERNRVLSLLPAEETLESTYFAFLQKHHLDKCVHNRVMACEGPRLLAWAGTFSATDALSMSRARWGLRMASRRLAAVLRRVIGLAPPDHEALSATLFDALAGEAYLVAASGRIEAANALGSLHLSRAHRALVREVREALRGAGATDFDVHRISASSSQRSYLLVRRAKREPRLESVIEAARIRWGLTLMETRVLRALTRGAANKEIAEETAISVRTVESHVNSIVRKSQSDSRLQVVSRVWLQS